MPGSPSLSVCLLAGDPAPRIAAALAPVRDVADEIVIAADARVAPETLAGYAGLADRLFTVDFRLYERHLAWLCAQCSGDWILRLDGDEVPSLAFARRLPELTATRAVSQFWVRRPWVFGGDLELLDERPWARDYNNRLVRNDGGLHVRGIQHEHFVAADRTAYVDEPVYHLELELADHEARRAKALRYEVARPGLTADGARLNEAFYLPELRASCATRPLPAEDRDAVRAALDGTAPVPPGTAAQATPVSLAEMDRHWALRTVAADAYDVRIRCLDDAGSFAPREQRRVFVELRNDSAERWPGGDEHEPLVRLSYHWLRADGSVHAEGPRTPLPGPVGPGETAIVPAVVEAPGEPGSYLLELDLVHEHVRWFERGCRLAVTVGEREPVLPPPGPRLVAQPVAGRRGLRRRRVPKLIHRVWLGDDEPADLQAFGQSFADHHPGWETRLWTDADLAELGIGDGHRARARGASELSNLARYAILHEHGGLYVDTDVECLRNFAPLLRGVDACAALERPGRVGTAVLAAVPGHRLYARARREAAATLGLGSHSADANGPYFMSLLIEQEPRGVTLYEPGVFYPYSWDEPERAGGPFPDAYAVHHWRRSWWGAEPGG